MPNVDAEVGRRIDGRTPTRAPSRQDGNSAGSTVPP
jgi:hypothetical protein